VIDVIDVRAMRRLETVPTEPGAHTTALDGRRHWLYVFLPEDASRGRIRRRVGRSPHDRGFAHAWPRVFGYRHAAMFIHRRSRPLWTRSH
jgi:hypothetical protein